MFEINGNTKICGLLGYPISHTKSPQLHNKWIRQYNKNGVYIPFQMCHLDKSFFDFLRFNDNILGLNVTIPYKQEVIEFLDDISEEVNYIKAVNTILKKEGKLIGYNTDYKGFVKPLFDLGFKSGNILLIGAGGASYAVYYSLINFLKIEHLFLINRTREKAEILASSFNFGNVSIIDKISQDLLNSCSLIINTTSLGMGKLADKMPFDLFGCENLCFTDKQIVYDLIYNPAETLLLKKAKQDGAKVINGMPMLIEQAKYSFEIWFGVYPDE